MNKVKKGLPPNKSESKGINSFLVGVRQASLSTAPYVEGQTAAAAAKASAKITRAADEVAKRAEDPKFRGLVYSSFIDAGARPMEEALRERGIRSEVFHGGLSPEEKARIVKDYNEGRLPIIIGTSSATEGLDLKGTRLIQILDPHFNQAKMDQVIGRGIRYKSHTHLPPEEREVLVQRFYAKPRPSLFGRLLGSKETGIDRWLDNYARGTQDLMTQMMELMQQASDTKETK